MKTLLEKLGGDSNGVSVSFVFICGRGRAALEGVWGYSCRSLYGNHLEIQPAHLAVSDGPGREGYGGPTGSSGEGRAHRVTQETDAGVGVSLVCGGRSRRGRQTGEAGMNRESRPARRHMKARNKGQQGGVLGEPGRGGLGARAAGERGLSCGAKRPGPGATRGHGRGPLPTWKTDSTQACSEARRLSMSRAFGNSSSFSREGLTGATSRMFRSRRCPGASMSTHERQHSAGQSAATAPQSRDSARSLTAS